ncbi:MAG: thiazole synthase [Candidatus Amulumruptor caecigallinarius]|nr:thiazole synthase [Candidatus Amulumruptor caecigallinarius]MCM1396691.1 thiazole synthase [Candidatus Amulumruptor caecigallinarius]MCM1453251.1 thiazole synthase [bacterium]
MTHTIDTDTLTIGGRTFSSRLFVGTGKFSSPDVMLAAIQASQSQMITVAMKRVNLLNEATDDMLTHINREHVQFLPNTSGVRDAREAVLAAQMSREIFGTPFIKLEIHPDPKYLLPDPIETLKATEELARDGFTVLPYVQADPVLCKRLEEVGAAAVMPLAAPIGTNKGMRTRDFIEIIIEQAQVPVVVDAGLGAPSHAADAMEMGADAVLVNTAISVARNPVEMAEAFRFAVIAGRKAHLAGLGSVSNSAEASSPLTAFLND